MYTLTVNKYVPWKQKTNRKFHRIYDPIHLITVGVIGDNVVIAVILTTSQINTHTHFNVAFTHCRYISYV